jgi:hypothetical protein
VESDIERDMHLEMCNKVDWGWILNEAGDIIIDMKRTEEEEAVDRGSEYTATLEEHRIPHEYSSQPESSIRREDTQAYDVEKGTNKDSAGIDESTT